MPKIKINFFLLFLLALFPLGQLHAGTVTTSPPVTYKIAGPIGDWGFPTPYGMYPRGPGYIRMSFIFDTLVWKNENGIIPALAKSYRYLPEENAYIFTLRDNITWHDGEKITADDVVFTFSYLNRHPWVWVDASMLEKAEKVDALTVKIFLEHPYAPFLTNIAGTLPILPRHIWEKVDKPETFRTKEALVGSGPFKLADYNKVQGSYLYIANDSYYRGKPTVQRLLFMKASLEAAPMMLKKKMINACALPGELVEQFKQDGFNVLHEPPSWVAKLVINHKLPLLDKKIFRTALARALDRDRIVSIVRRGHAVPGNPGIVPSSNKNWHCPHVPGYDHEPARVRDTLEKIGFAKGNDGYYYKDGKILHFELLTSTSRVEFTRLAEFIKQQFKKVGIKITITGLEGKTVDNRVLNWQFQLALSGHGGLGGDPAFLKNAIAGDRFHSARFNRNPELNNLLNLQMRITDPGKRKEIVWKIQVLFAEELPAICLYYPKTYWAHDGSIDLFYTEGGVASGIPIPINKIVFVK